MLFFSLMRHSRSRKQSSLLSRARLLTTPLLALAFLVSSAFPQSKSALESFDSLSKRADEARDSDRLDEAVSLYKKALALHPEWAEGWWSLGTIEYDRNHYSAAARAFRQFLPLSPKDGTAHAMLGLCEFELHQDAAALKHIEEAKSLGVATNTQLRLVTLYHDGILLLRAGQFKAAQASLIAVCAKEMQPDDVLQYLGLAFLRVLPKDAPPPLTPGAKVVLRVGHAACLTGEKKFDEARQDYSSLVNDYPDYPNIHYAYGRFLVDVNDGPGGIEQFKLELKNQPDNVNSRLEIAAAQYKVDSAAGLPYAEEAVKLDPHLPFAHYLLGLLYLDTDHFQQAVPALEFARKAFPTDKRLLLALASAYSRVGRKQDAANARAAFERLSQRSSSSDSTATY
jgi:tetratricopeptide (TPR) repeat protein